MKRWRHCTCQDTGSSYICFSDPIFEDEIFRCPECTATSGCSSYDDCVYSGCESCGVSAAEAAASSCGTSSPSSPTAIDGESPSSPPDIGGGGSLSGCFPADAYASIRDGSKKIMKDVEIDDMVQTGPNKFSRVFSFTHRDSNVQSRFIELVTDSGRRLQLTPGHFIYVDNVPTAAKHVKVGDKLMGEEGNPDVVRSAGKILNTGLYNAQTVDGDIVVGGLVSSTYTDALHLETAHSLPSPLRMLYRICGAAPLNSEKSIL